MFVLFVHNSVLTLRFLASRFKLKNMAQGYAENTAKEYAQKAAATAMKEYAKQTMSSFNPFKSS